MIYKPVLVLLGLIWVLGMLYGTCKHSPPGVGISGPLHPAEVEFFYDLSYRPLVSRSPAEEQGGSRRLREHHILEAMLAEIGAARRLIVLDMFLFNRLGGEPVPDGDARSPVILVTEALLAAREREPQISILLISDEINNGYGSYKEPHLRRLAANGVKVVFTRLTALPDSNPIYSGLWRPLLQWFTPSRGTLPNPFEADGPPMHLASYLRLLNFKANHRKLLITERAAVVSSANLHDASSDHSNIAFKVKGGIIADLIASELAVARFSSRDFSLPSLSVDGERGPADSEVGMLGTQARLITENAIKKALLAGVEEAGPGDRVSLAQFYLAHRPLISALVAAARRGTEVRLILDPNRDAFGRDKHGIPNLSTAAWLKRRGGDNLKIRWYDTAGEQFHAKLIMIEYAYHHAYHHAYRHLPGHKSRGGEFETAHRSESGGLVEDGEVLLIGGSANLTRRNLDGYNLESNLEIRAAPHSPVSVSVRLFFERIWENHDGHYTVDYQKYAQENYLKELWARWQEYSGIGTF